MIPVEALRDTIRGVHLNDPDADEFTDADIESAIFSAEIVHAIHLRQSTAKYIEFDCAAGSRQTLQNLTTPKASMLIDVDREGDAATIGDAIYRVPKQDLDKFNPSWQQAAAAAPREFTYSETEPLAFFLNPPVAASQKIMITICAVPEPYGAVDSSTVTTVLPIYEESVREYALYVLFGKDTEGSVNSGRSAQHLQLASNLMGVEMQSLINQSAKNPKPKR